MDEEELIEATTVEILETYQPWIKSVARTEAFKRLNIDRYEIFSAAELCSLTAPKVVMVESEVRYRQGYRNGYLDALNAIPSKNLIAKVRDFFEREIMPWSYIRTRNLVPPPTYK